MYPGADMLALNNESMTPLDILNRKIARKVGSLDKTSVYMQAQRKDDPDALKTVQVPDAVSGHPTERESIKDDTSLVKRSHGPPTNSP
ncbi:hypothetical protein RHSIM_RhsimUnG0174400 [Rhododendron simsii]|uniref:Uncharacterized protein n=1 Tax=Rhododendron simsii TaxID=118357 RepID=A0A834L4A7_RHOSS|nr:hypothetical protein RHSIM_RhsimUnG0174400 [Rhododendron simsii]